MGIIRDFFDPLIDEALARKSERANQVNDEGGEEIHFIDRLVEATNGISSPIVKLGLMIDRQLTHDQIINILIAARDTVSRPRAISASAVPQAICVAPSITQS
jgi:hypothetical protein